MVAKNVHDGHRKRMRERCIKDGAGVFEDHQLVEMLLYYSIPRKDTNEIAHNIISKCGSLSNIIYSNPKDLINKYSLTENQAILFNIIGEILKRCSMESNAGKPTLSNNIEAGEYVYALLRYEKQECFYVICLDAKNRVINTSLISEGTANTAHVYPKSVVETVLRHNATNVIFAHNHPSGGLRPSFNDIDLTNELSKIMKFLDINVVDHIIVAENSYFSFAGNGFLK
ncbi:MAG: DNA repair protein RadC [Lachnospiraceae bacterium]|nr:DNA repair protein RadC [Lachnospiraceae bacterium]